MLARMAASAENPKSLDNEAAIEKYLRSVLAVENILTLDRLRQVKTDSLILSDAFNCSIELFSYLSSYSNSLYPMYHLQLLTMNQIH